MTTETITWLSKTCSVAWTLPLPGGIAGPRKIATSGVAIALSTSHAITNRRPCAVSAMAVGVAIG